ncbi:DUF6734 family protein [Flammeovirga kamogawensis]|uniref:Peptidase C39 domain-containing protein n=1 Tax=Flammeovirga kamogawensis TaxID=373891 RepID=A0ABX8GSZ4_9BACT|nr:DUF6734 family protein [Flammeovirga kamogawensis]MBB6461376.1 hypothetical protein [Flammeovirga kamogawensis]QWG06277.1 hypothetical protein KM029_13140 [Flammeovirga kamogawensis]TRX68107.1 hypothetical protein EO216_08160 [Flammeovirga kamogawensis]
MLNIIQTYWNANNSSDPILNDGGFLCPEIHWMSWALSCSQLNKFYSKVDLHTDYKSSEVFKALKIPYNKIHLSLESEVMKNMDSRLWAYSKLHTYSLQKEAFLHVDGDVFIWEKFDEKLLHSNIICQNVEEDLNIYKFTLKEIKKINKFHQGWIDVERKIKALNAGIIGGIDIDFFKEYTKLAFDFYNENKHLFNQLTSVNNINVISEQYLLYQLIEKKNKTYSLLSDKVIETTEDFHHFVKVHEIPYKTKYLHTLSKTKQQEYICNFISFALRIEYPEIWEHIVLYFKENNILSSYFKRHLKCLENENVLIEPGKVDFKKSYSKTIKLSELTCLEFNEKNQSSIQINPVILDSYNQENIINNLKKRSYKKNCNSNIPWLFYSENDILDSYFLKKYIKVTPFHDIFLEKYNIQDGGILIKDNKIVKANIHNQIKITFTDLYYYSTHTLTIDPILLNIIEEAKKRPMKVEEIMKKYFFQNESKKFFTNILRIWINYGLITLSDNRKDFINSPTSKFYNQYKDKYSSNTKNCLLKYLDLTELDYNRGKIHKIKSIKSAISIAELINILKKINLNAQAVKGTMESLNKIPLPIIALIQPLNYSTQFVIITSISEDNIIIYNPIYDMYETYNKNYFKKLWDGVLIFIQS